MAYIKRDHLGKIIAFSRQAEPDFVLEENLEEDELRLFFAQELANADSKTRNQLVETDSGIARVTEDLIHLLISKNVILFTDLPGEVQTKLIERDKLREGLNTAGDMEEGDTI